VAALESSIGTPDEAAALPTPTSASSCAIESTPTGARKNGAGECIPSTSTEMSRTAFPASIRGRIRQLWNASRLARIVDSAPAPPAM
jgi:hypothetical protein